MHTHNVRSFETMVTVIMTTLRTIGMRPERPDVRKHVFRAMKGLKRFDALKPGWAQSVQPGQVDLRFAEKHPTEVFKAVGGEPGAPTSEVAQQEGLVALDSMDQVEVATLGLAWNFGIAERQNVDYGPFRIEAAA